MNIRSAAVTHVGLVRAGNEDRFCEIPGKIYAVADGMGGHEAGEIAAQIAVDEIAKVRLPVASVASDVLRLALLDTHKKICEHSRTHAGHYGMGTTLTALGVSGGRGFVAHAGDSRCYRVVNGEAVQLTKDHGAGHRLYNALGINMGSYKGAELCDFPLHVGEHYVLCSDGFGDYLVGPEDLAGIFAELPGATPRMLAQACVDYALCGGAGTDAPIIDTAPAGGHDNVTVLVIEVGP